ncbi:unnamed protein product, partial [Candidula unifasciata]
TASYCFIVAPLHIPLILKKKTKLESKKETLSKQLAKLIEAAATPDYETKVPEKVAALTAEIQTISNGIETLLKLE